MTRQKTFKDLTGKRFGRLVVLGEAETRFTPKGQRVIMWKCRCDCGNEKEIRGTSLKSGRTTSCGCYYMETRNGKLVHGFSHKERLYGVWTNIKDRCYNPKNNHYKSYGGRGISLCDEWLHDYPKFREWCLANGYKEEVRKSGRNNLTIDRIDNDGNYEPSNCRWVTNRENCLNKQDTMSDEERYKTCPVCGKKFKVAQRNHQKTCGMKCGHILREITMDTRRNQDGTFKKRLQTNHGDPKEAKRTAS